MCLSSPFDLKCAAWWEIEYYKHVPLLESDGYRLLAPIMILRSITATEAEVCAWLVSLGLSEHCPAFTRNHVDGQVLRELAGDDDLLKTEVGMLSFGHR